jgi:hypothetical protein
MPAAAFADSQYLGGTALVSKTSDNDDAAPTLGYSEPSRVQNPVGPPVPEVGQTAENDTEVGTPVAGKESRNILNDAPPWPQLAQDPLELKPETAALAG